MNFLQEIITGLLCLVVYAALWEFSHKSQLNDLFLLWEHLKNRKISKASVNPDNFFLTLLQSNGQYSGLVQKSPNFSAKNKFPILLTCKSKRGFTLNQSVRVWNYLLQKFSEVAETGRSSCNFIPNLLLRLICKPSFIFLFFFSSFAFSVSAQTQTYSTGGTYTFTVPAGVTSITVEAWGGGGGGGFYSTNWNGAGGGGGGAYASRTLTVIPGFTYNITVGAGGSYGNSGGQSRFESYVVALGGGTNTTNSNGGAGGSAAGSTGTVKYSGGNGGNGGPNTNNGGGGGGSSATASGAGVNGSSNSGSNGGAGGNGTDGDGGNGGRGSSGTRATDGTGPGGGGGGRGDGNGSSGSGADGQVIITWAIPSGYCSGNAISVYSQTNVNNSTRAVGSPNSSGAELHESGDVLILELTSGDLLTAGGTIDVTWNRTSSNNSVILIEISADGSTWSTVGNYTNIPRNAWTTQSLPLSINTRYVKFTSTLGWDLDIDAVSYYTPCAPPCISPVITSHPTDPAAICSGVGIQTLSVTATGTSLSYSWRKDGAAISNNSVISGQGTTTLTLTNPTSANDGWYDVRVSNACGIVYSNNNIHIVANTIPATPGAISGTNPQCPALTGQVYSITPISNATSYTWTVPSGWSITSGAGTESITVSTGSAGQNGNISVTASNSCGTSAARTLAVTVSPGTPATPGTISGTTPQCPALSGQVYSISSVTNATTYTWSVPTGWSITSGAGTTSITVTTGSAGQNGNISVTAGNSCGTSTAQTLAVTVNPGTPAVPGAITGTTPQCPAQTGQVYSISAVTNATTYTWSVPAGWSITSGAGTTSITVTSGSAGQNGNISVTAGNSCGTSTARNLAVTVSPGTPAVPGAIAGTTPQCPALTGQVYSISAVTNATTYTWTVPTGWSITSGAGTTSITVTTGSAGQNGNISVTAGNSCGTSGARTLAVTVDPGTPATPGAITGTTPQCPAQTGQVYSISAVTDATTYTWTVPTGWSITSGAGTTSITVTSGNAGQNGNVTVTAGNSCGTSAARTFAVTVDPGTPAVPGVITGTTPQCPALTGQVYSISAVTNATTYTWTLPTGWSITAGAGTTSITVTTGSAGQNGNISVTAGNSCGTSAARTFAVTVDPGTPAVPGAITGTTPQCPALTGQVYSISAVTDATTYTWTVPTGWSITSGAGTTSITVTSGTAGQNGNISVTAGNSCGTSAAQTFAVTVDPGTPAVPGAITGTTPQCPAQTGQVYSISAVTNATTYTWSVPAGWSITSGAGTTSITVTTGSAGQNGNISVTSGNSCGTSAARTLAVTVDPGTPAVPGAITGTTAQCPALTGQVYSISAVTDATTYIWTVPTGWSITSGAGTTSITVTTGSAGQNGNISVTAGNSCGTSTARTLAVTVDPGTPAVPGVITGTTPQCPALSGQVYSITSVTDATTYTWTVPTGWSITSGAGTTSITVTTGSAGQNGNISVTAGNSCGTSAARTLAVTVDPGTPAVPGAITGTTPQCPALTGQVYSITSVTDATTYSWTVPTGWSITSGAGTTSITVTSGTAGQNGNISVTAGNSCGTSATRTFAVTVNPDPTVDAGSAVTAICQGETTAALGGSFGGGATSAIWNDGGAGGSFTNNGGSTPETTTYTASAASGASVTLTLTTSGGTCGTVSANKTLTVNPNPTVDAGSAVSAICQGGTTVTLGGSFGGGATSAIWSDGGAGGTFTNNGGLTPGTTTYTASAASGSSVTLTLTSSGGSCGTVSANKTLTVNPNPTVDAGSAVSAICQGGTTVALGGSFGGGATAAIWSDGGAGGSFTNNGGSTPGTTTYTASAASGSSVTLTLTSSGGSCSTVSANKTLTVNPIPTVDAGGAVTAICQGGTTVALGGSFGGGATAAVWSDGGAGGTFTNNGGSTPGTTTYTASAASGSSVTLTLTSSGGSCGIVSAYKTLTVNPNPTVDAGSAVSAICQSGTTAALGGSFGGGATSAIWSDGGAGGTFTNNGGSTPGTTTYTASAASGSSVTLTLTTSGSSCGSVSANKTLTVNPNPTVNAGSAVSAICQGETTAALGGSFGGGATSAIWSDGGAGGTFTNNGGSTPETTTYTASAASGSFVTLTLTSSGGSCGTVSANKTLTVNANPVVDAGSAVSAICQGETTAALGGSFGGGATAAIWSDGGAGGTFSNNGGSTPGTTTYTASASSGSSVTLTLTTSGSSCGSISANKTLTVNPNPTVDVGGAISDICQGGTTSALGGSFGGGATSAVWSDGGAGGTFTNNDGSNPNITTYTASLTSGTPVTLTLTTSGGVCGINSASKTVTVKPLVGTALPITGSIYVLPATTGLIYSIPAVANATNYVWTVPAGWTITSGQNTNSITVKSGTAFQDGDITVTPENDCGTSAAATLAVSVNSDLIIIEQPQDQTDCDGSSVVFTVAVSGGAAPISYVWQRDTGSGFSVISGDPDITYPAAGSMLVANIGSLSNPSGAKYRALVTDAGLVTVTSGEAILTTNKITGISPADQVICEAEDMSFTVSTTGTVPVGYQWKKLQSPGVWNDVNDGGSISGATTATLTFTGAVPTDAGEYEVQVEFPITQPNDNGGNPSTCFYFSSVQRKLSVNPLPTLSGPSEVCTGQTINWLPATGGTWVSSDPAKAGITNSGLVTGIAVGTVSFTFTETATGCKSTSSSVQVNPLPTAVISGNSSICAGASADISIALTGTAPWNITYTDGTTPVTITGILSSPHTINVTPPATTTYTLTAASDANCTATSLSGSSIITIIPLPTATLSGSTTICNGTSANLSVALTGISPWTLTYTDGTTPVTISGITGSPYLIAVSPTVNTSYTVTSLNDANCTGTTFTGTATISIDELPTASAGGSQTICSTGTATISGASSTNGTILWTHDGSGTISGATTLSPTYSAVSADQGKTITLTMTVTSNNVCTPQNATAIYTVNVDKLPTATAGGNETICHDGSATVSGAAATDGTVLWTHDGTGTISNAGTLTPTYTAGVGDEGKAVILTMTVTSSNLCAPQKATAIFTVNVLASPVVTQPLNKVFCNNETTTLISFGGTGTLYTWTNNSPGIGLAASGSGNIASFTALNAGTSPVVATITVTPYNDAGGLSCTGLAKTFTITVNPTAQVNQPADIEVCTGTVIPASTFSSNNTGGTLTYSWTNDNSSIGLAVIGTGNIPSFTATNVTNATVVATITVSVIFSNGGVNCNGPNKTFTITVLPIPVVTATPSSQIICSSETTNIALSSNVSGTTLSWTVAESPAGSITGATAGSGSTIAQTLVNTGSSPATLTYTITPKANGCDGNPLQVVVTVNPKPILSSTLTPSAICSNSLFSYSPTSATAGTTFTWSRSPILGISPGSGSGSNNPNETLINLSAAPINVTYVYTLTANGCTNVQNVVVEVLPELTLSSAISTTTCSNTLFSYIPTSLLPVSFDWTRAAVAGVSNAAASGTGEINETLINTTPASVVVNYVYTLKIGVCVGTQTVQVTVKPSPTLTSSLTPPAICNNSPFVYTPTSATSPVTFAWYRAIIAGISNSSNAGVNGINETLINTTPNPITVRYEYTLRSSGCQTIQYVDVVVNPTPVLTSSLSPADVCSNSTFNYTPTSLTAGTTFSWTRAAIAGNPASSGSGVISEVLTAATTFSASYVISLTANGCTNVQNVVVVVNQLPVISVSPASPTICNGTGTVLTASGASTYVWSPSTGLSSTTGATVTASPLINTTYTVTGTDVNGCVSSTTVTVSVLPKPDVTVSPAISICRGFSTDLTAAGAVTYDWSPSTGLSATTGATVTATPTSTTTYTVTGTDANGCTNTATVKVTVFPLPNITVSPSSASICDGTSTTLTASGAVSYDWSESGVSFSTDPSVTVSPSVTTTYTVTGTNANGCVNTRNVTVTVKPLPVLTNPNPSPAVICSNTKFIYAPTSSMGGTSYSWSRAAIAGISNPAASGTGSINETLINTSNSDVPVTYTYSLTAGGCTNPSSFNVVIVVRPAPMVTASATSTTICEGESTTLSSTSNLGTTSLPPVLLTEDFNSAAAGSKTGPNGWTTTLNSGSGGTPANADWTVRQDGYSNAWQTFNSNDASNFYLTDNRSQGNGTALTTLVTPAINTNGYITLSLDFFHYYDDNSSSRAYIDVSTDGSSWNNVTSYNSDNGGSSNFIQPPTVNLSAYINNPTLYIRFRYTASNTDRYWAIDNVSVTGTSTSSTAISWTSIPAGFTSTSANPPAVSPTVTTTYIASYSDPLYPCPGTGSVTITVNPKPVMTSSDAVTICSGDSPSLALTSDIPSTYTWVAASNGNVGGESTSVQSSGTINDVLTNSTTTAQTVVYTVTPTTISTGCVGNPQTVNVVVNPIPTVNNISNVGASCSGTAGAAINFGSNVVSPTYNWTSTIDVGFGLSGTGNIPAYTKFNDTDSPVVATVSVTATKDGCTGPANSFTVTVNPLPTPVIDADYCAVPGKIRLTVTGLTGSNTFLWSNGMTGNPIDVDIAAGYNVTVTNSYGCSATAILPVSNELVVNGDFTNTNLANPAIDFVTGYTYKQDQPGLVPAGQGELWNDSGTNGYSITTSGQEVHLYFYGKDHTNNSTGPRNFMAVNGHGTITIWQQTVNVVPNTTYYYSAWGMNLNPTSPARLQFQVNGVNIGTIADLNAAEKPTSNGMVGLSNWVRFYYGASSGWFSGANTTATIRIVDLNSALGGNDFGLDDISFGTLDPVMGTINPAVAPGPVCQYGSLQLLANKTSTKAPFTYSWTGPDGFTSTEENPVISNISSANNGTYSLTFVDGYGCETLTGSVDVLVNPAPVCSITGSATSCPNSTGNTYSAPAGMASYVWSVTGDGILVGSANTIDVDITAGASCSGSFTVSLLITDSNGCTSTCSQVVSLVDNNKPTWTTVAGNLDRTLECSDAAGLVAAQALTPAFFDQCSALISPVKTSGTLVSGGTCSQAGTITNTWLVTDVCGNEVATPFTQVITITDNTAPTWTTAANALNQNISCSDAAGLAAAQAMEPVATDLCGTVSYTKTSGTFVAGGCGGNGSYTNTWIAKDECLNTSTVFTQVISISDTELPVWTSAAGELNATVECSDSDGLAAAQLLVPTAFDACSPTITPVKTSGTFVSGGSCSQAGTYTNTWTVSDACGNAVASVYTQVITVVDQTKPEWVTPFSALNRYVECGNDAGIASAQLLMPEATDNCDPTLVVVKTPGAFVEGTPPCINAGSYTNTFTVTDDCGNVSDVFTQTIILEDYTPPVIIAPPVAVISCVDNPTPALTGTATATDACGSSISITYADGAPVAGNCDGESQVLRTWTATDACGNSSTATQYIFSMDITPPDITTAAQDINVVCDGAGNVTELNNWLASHGGAIASDVCGSVTWSNDFSSLSTSCGSTEVTFIATDGCLNSSTTTASFIITDAVGPTLTCPPPATGTVDLNECFSTNVILGAATATDNCSADAEIIITNNAPIQYPLGVSIVTWTATDVCGNTSTCDQTVTVTDNNQNPSITCPGPVVQTAGAGDCFLNNVIIPSPVTSDNCAVTKLTWSMSGATSLSSPATGINSVSGQNFNVGITTVTYTAFDAAGNSTSCSFDVTILDLVPPVFTLGCPDPISVDSEVDKCDAFVNVPAPAYSDPCLELTTIAHDSPYSSNTDNADGTYPVGTTTITWTITDASGNTATCEQQIIVVDVAVPTITCPADVEDEILDGSCGMISSKITEPVLTNNCSVPELTYLLEFPNGTTTTGTGSVSGLVFLVGTTIVTYTATSDYGLTVDCSFNVTIKNLTSPQFAVTCRTGAEQTILADAVSGGCTAYVVVLSPEISNPCNELYTIVNDFNSTDDASGTYPIGSTTVTWTITDGSGNVTTCIQTIVVNDTQAPTISCPANVVDFILAGNCDMVSGNFTEPVIGDNCPNPVLSYNLDFANGTSASGLGSVSGLAFPTGLTTVTYTVTDVGGLEAECTFTVLIKNLVAPQLSVTCRTGAEQNITQMVDPGQCTADVTLLQPIISNPCNEFYTQVNDFNGTDDASGTYPFGLTTINWTITDASGNESFCIQTVRVTDVPPTLNCPASLEYWADSNSGFKDNVAVPVPTYSVNCSDPTLTWEMVYPAGDPRPSPTTGSGDPSGIDLVPSPARFYEGVTSITYTVADINGNSSSCTFTITIRVKPEITCLGPVAYIADPGKCWHTVLATDADNPGVPTLDAGSQSIVWTWTVTNPDGTTASGTSTTTDISPVPAQIGPYDFQKGVSTILWHAENPSGSDECTQEVTVTEDQPATFTVPADLEKCVEPIQSAIYDPGTIDITPERPEYYLFVDGNTELDLTDLADNCCDVSNLTIHWRIDYSDTPDPNNQPGGIITHPSVSGTGQPSSYISTLPLTGILLPGDGVNFTNVFHTITYWIEDCEGNLSGEQSVNITIKPRPKLIKMP